MLKLLVIHFLLLCLEVKLGFEVILPIFLIKVLDVAL